MLKEDIKWNDTTSSSKTREDRKEWKERNKEYMNEKKIVKNMININPRISVINISRNGLIIPIKRQRLT